MKGRGFLLLCLLFALCFGRNVYGAERGFPGEPDKGPIGELEMGQYDLSDIEKFLDKTKGSSGFGLSFGDLMKALLEGKLGTVAEEAGRALKDLLLSEIESGGHMMGQIIVLGILGAVFTNFSGVFTGNQISETGFFVTYLLLFTYLAASFFASVAIAGEVVSQILDFMKALIPAYFLAAAFAGSSASALASYEFTLFAITAVQWLIGQVLLPAVRIYALFVMAGHIAKEDLLSKFTGLLEQGVRFSLRTMLGLVLGFHVIQAMVLPYVDSMKNGALGKLVGSVPGIGPGVSNAAQMVLGSGVVIKNTIGAAGIVVLFIISAIPLLKLLVLMVLYQCVAALLQPVSDKRIISCISDMANGHKMLLSVTISAMFLFVITIALVCISTNVTYYSF